MRTGASDTDPAAERVHLDLLRRATPERRAAMALELSAAVLTLSRDGVRRRTPGASDRELAVRWVELCYGRELAEAVRRRLEDRGDDVG